MLCFQRHKLYSVCIWFILHLLKKYSKTLRNLSKREHLKLFAMGPVLMWFVIWHNKESRGHNMETNQLQITTMLQFHITFTLASITLCSRAVAVISQQWPVTLLLPSDFIDFMIYFWWDTFDRWPQSNQCEHSWKG